MTLDERLDAYPLLPPDERAAVERDVADHPEWAARLAEAKVLAAVLDGAYARPVTTADVARRETDRLLGHTTPDADRIDAEVAADPVLAAEAERVQARLAVLAATAEPATDQFARLTGVSRLEPAAPDARPAAPDRAAAPPPRARRASGLRRLVVAASVMAAAYAAAFVGTQASRPERERMADLRDLTSYQAPQTRGDAASTTERLGSALNAVGAARRTTLGLFPRYDAAALDAAAAELVAVAAGAEPLSSVSQEARFALGRVRLHQGRDADAARLFGALVRDGGYRAPEARRLLDWIRTQPSPA